MKLSIDLDGVICSFTKQIIGVANSLWPGKLAPDYEPRDYGYKEGLTRDEWDQVWDVIRKDPTFYESGPAYEDNMAALKNFLHNHSGHEIYFVTSRRDTGGKSVAIQTMNWLTDYDVRPGLNYMAVIPVSSPDAKKFVMADLDIAFSIDDMGTTVEQCSVLQGHKAFLLDRSWNRDRNYGPRLSNLNEYFDRVLGVVHVNG